MSILKFIDKEKSSYDFFDNLVAESMVRIGVVKAFKKVNTNEKRSGDSVASIIFTLAIFPVLAKKSLNFFCGLSLKFYINGGKSVLYDFQKREDLDWRKVQNKISFKIIKIHGDGKYKSIIVDDTIKKRRGKLVEGTSSHFDHTESRSVMGQQVLQIGYSDSSIGFLPLDQQIFVSNKKQQGLHREFIDENGFLSKNYDYAHETDKNDMLGDMVKKCKSIGAEYLLADAWFNNKKNIKMALSNKLTPIFRSKRDKTKYLFEGKTLTISELFLKTNKKMKSMGKTKWNKVSLVVKLNLNKQTNINDTDDQLTKIKIIFVQEKCHSNTNGKFATFLTTGTDINDEEILKIYGLRWQIEVYFKEVKQHLHFLSEQSGNFAVHYFSINFSAIRYCLIKEIMITEGFLTFGEARDSVMNCIEVFSVILLGWDFIRPIVKNQLSVFSENNHHSLSGDCIDGILNGLEAEIQCMLQLSDEFLISESK